MIQPRLKLDGMTIVVGGANGACYQVGPAVFEELGATVIATGVKPNGLNINDGVGSTCIDHVQQMVVDHKADLGIAFDGDGDRLIMVDGDGPVLDGDELLYDGGASTDQRYLGRGRGGHRDVQPGHGAGPGRTTDTVCSGQGG